jgi:hypothetical protein
MQWAAEHHPENGGGNVTLSDMRNVRIRAFGLLDTLILVVLGLCAIGSVSLLQIAAGAECVVYRDDTVVARYPLAENRVVTVEGAVGKVTLEVSDGAVRVAHSSCPRRICVASGAIRQPGSQLICVPNHIVIEIAGPQPAAAPDAIVR